VSAALLETSLAEAVYTIRLARPQKRNAINDRMLSELDRALDALPAGARVILLVGDGEHFCAGLDLSEHQDREPFAVARHSQGWHRVFHRLQHGGIPVVAALHGAVIGGGLELACSTHVRVAEPDTIYQLPEGRHGIFVGGGGSVRIARIIGAGRMTEMMLTGRIYQAEEGQQLGLSHYLAAAGTGEARARELALRVAENAPMANWAMVSALPRIDDMGSEDGLFVESLVAALTHTGPEVAERIGRFLQRKGQGPQE
jgi:(methylthio)acryloyl-CoA hydratase